MLVTEDITAAFTGEYHWISRSIPIEYPGPSGTNYTLFLEDRRRYRRESKALEV